MSDLQSIETTYLILKAYLNGINYNSEFSTIDAKTSFDLIGNYIDSETTKKSTPEKTIFSIDDLHQQLDDIIYLSTLSYFYVYNSTLLGVPYLKLIRSPLISKTKLTNTKDLLNEKIQLFKNTLQSLLDDEENTDANSLKQLANGYIQYLQAVVDAKISTLAKYAGEFIGEVDFKKIKTDAQNNIILLNKQLEEEFFFDAEDRLTTEQNQENLEEDKDEFFDAEDGLTTEQNQENLLVAANSSNDCAPTSVARQIPAEENQANHTTHNLQRFIDWFKQLLHRLANIINPTQQKPDTTDSATVAIPQEIKSLDRIDDTATVSDTSQKSSVKTSILPTSTTWEKKHTPSKITANPYVFHKTNNSLADQQITKRLARYFIPRL